MMSIKFISTITTLVCFFYSISCNLKNSQPDLHIIQGQTMGTAFHVKFKNINDATNNIPKIESEINTLLTEINRQMSTYMNDSEISNFNRYRGIDWFPISGDFEKVLNASLEISSKCGGAFDITIGPILNLWGFGIDKQQSLLPPDHKIKDALSLIGFQHLSVRSSPPSIKKNIPEIYIDLSAIAKGFGVDKIGEYLESKGIESYMVEIGGEIRTKGRSSKNEHWNIGIQSPAATGTIQRVIRLTNAAVATSGDYMNYFEKDGVRYSHTIDPHTGSPVSHNLASVTVIHQSCMIADGLATAINVLGPEKGFKFALQEKLAVLMIVRENGAFVEKFSSLFESYVN
jgi:thiamine biosynthesis lipoprotein